MVDCLLPTVTVTRISPLPDLLLVAAAPTFVDEELHGARQAGRARGQNNLKGKALGELSPVHDTPHYIGSLKGSAGQGSTALIRILFFVHISPLPSPVQQRSGQAFPRRRCAWQGRHGRGWE